MSKPCGCVHRKYFEQPGRGPQSTDYLDDSGCRFPALCRENVELHRRAGAAEHNFAVEHDALVAAEAHCYDVESGEIYLRLTAQRDALAAALRTYGRHCVGCSMARKISPGQCDCGFIVATLTLTGIPAPPSKLKPPNLSRGFEVHVPPREVKNG